MRTNKWVLTSIFVIAASLPMQTSAQSIGLSEEKIVNGLVPLTGNDTRSVDLNITFKLGSSQITETAKAQLDALGRALKTDKLNGLKVDILGHTDASGKAYANQALSEARARSVRAYLIKVHAIKEKLLVAQGRGETELLENHAPNDAANRRVEVVVHAPAHEPKNGQASPESGITAIN